MTQPASYFTGEQAEQLRRRFVIDRIDGRPLITGRADCPDCKVPLVPDAMGTMEFLESALRLSFQLRCAGCARILSLEEDFDWGP